MKNWWRKWSYEVPLAFGDALWAFWATLGCVGV
ncbi:MAG: hypothetical protein JWR49_1150, partial [Tardiphaga sp.]|nr:hypothetical protein [Tardiphaga sp.]